MKRVPIAAALALAFAFAGATAAFAATQEFTITVPVTIKQGGVPPGTKLATTVSCAVGRGSLAYSTADGTATGGNGMGSTKVDVVANVLVNVKVVVTDTAPIDPASGLPTGKGASQYLCWAKLSAGATPVNFISGDIH
jgi:hypothetical protein